MTQEIKRTYQIAEASPEAKTPRETWSQPLLRVLSASASEAAGANSADVEGFS